MCQKPHDEAAADAGKPVDERWKYYMDKIFPSVAVRPGAERNVILSITFSEDGQVTEVVQLPHDGDDPVEGGAKLPAHSLREELPVSVKWLYELKHPLLLAVETYKTLLVCHLLLLLITISVLVAMARA